MSTTKKTLAVAGAVAAALTAVTAPHASAQAKENPDTFWSEIAVSSET